MIKRLRNLVLLALLGLAAAELVPFGGRFVFFENIFTDFFRQVAGLRYQPQEVVIISVDDATLASHPDLPLAFWSPVFAKAAQVLREAGAAVTGFDLLFSLSVEDWLKKLEMSASAKAEEYDLPFKEELSSGRNVLAALMVFDAKGQAEISLPVNDFYFALPAPRRAYVGLANFQLDPDGVARNFVSRLAPEGPLSLGPLLAARLSGQNPEAGSFVYPGRNGVSDSASLPIDYCGPPGSVPRVSLWRLLAKDAAGDPGIIEAVRGKAAIIALEPKSSQDVHPTPYSRSLLGLGSRLMSGPELHANILLSLITGRFTREAGWPLRLGFETLFALAGAAGFLWLSPWRGALWLTLLGLSQIVLAYASFTRYQHLPLSGGLAGLGLCYLCGLGFRLSREEKLRRKMRGIFGRYVSDAVVEKLLAANKLPNLGGELCEVTVLFSDIRNFTSFSERLSPEQVLGLLNGYFSQVCEVILKHGGSVDKFIGDAVMAVFGAPARQEDHAARALACAREMLTVSESYARELRERFSELAVNDFRIGVGVNSGRAVIGNVGSPKRLEYTAIGDVVNTASRLESLCKEFKVSILASRATVEAANAWEYCGPLRQASLKGKSDAVEVCEVFAA